MSEFKQIIGKIERELIGVEAGAATLLLGALDKEHERETQGLSGELREVKRKNAEQKDALDSARDQIQALRGEVQGGRLIERLWDKNDGRRIIEAAFAHDPVNVRMALNSLGGSLIAGELRDKALLAAAPERRPRLSDECGDRCCDDQHCG